MPKKKRTPTPQADGTYTDPALQEAYDAGYEKGDEEGYDRGYEDGLEAERPDDESEGEEEELTDDEKYQQGHAAGYKEGYEAGCDTVTHDAQARPNDDEVGEHEELGDDGKIRPLRRILGPQEYWTGRGEHVYFAALSCGHMDEDPRPEAAIQHDAQRRRRVGCDECQRDF